MQAWGQNAGALETPTLDTWRATSGLPWVGFWFRELLRWGTLDPFVAFALAQGLARTREEADARRPAFEQWLAEEGLGRDAEMLIDPQRFIGWQKSLARPRDAADAVRISIAQLTGVDGRRASYDVRPIVRDDGTSIAPGFIERSGSPTLSISYRCRPARSAPMPSKHISTSACAAISF